MESRHAEFIWDQKSTCYMVRDLGSVNGVSLVFVLLTASKSCFLFLTFKHFRRMSTIVLYEGARHASSTMMPSDLDVVCVHKTAFESLVINMCAKRVCVWTMYSESYYNYRHRSV